MIGFFLVAATVPQAELVAHWRFEADGTNSVGPQFAGRLVGAPPTTAGPVGHALTFDGRDDAVSLSAEGLFDGWAAASVTAWVRPERKPADKWPTLIEKASGGKPKTVHVLWVGLHGPSGRWAIQLATDRDENLFCGLRTRVRYDEWHHVAVIVDLAARQALIYVNGRLTQKRHLPIRGTVFKRNPSGECAIGMIAQGNSNRWKGAVDEVRVYRGALSEDEVAALASDQ